MNEVLVEQYMTIASLASSLHKLITSQISDNYADKLSALNHQKLLA